MLYSIQYSYQKEYIPNRNLRYFPTENGRKFVGKHLIEKKKKGAIGTYQKYTRHPKT